LQFTHCLLLFKKTHLPNAATAVTIISITLETGQIKNWEHDMNSIQLVEKYLAADPLHYIPISESLRRGMAEIVQVTEDSLLTFNREGRSFYLSVRSLQALQSMLSLLSLDCWVLLHELAYRPNLEAIGFKCFHAPAFTAAYLKPDIELPQVDGLEIRPLTEEYLPLVLEHYRLIPDAAYIRERIAYGMLGAFYRSEPAGFVGVHDEGSMGMLEVFPGFRRLGIGSALGAYMIKNELQRGHIPYDEYFAGNLASRNLQEKLGFSFSDQPVIWMGGSL
jgi:GNAT superfamily N-acetyltransferase